MSENEKNKTNPVIESVKKLANLRKKPALILDIDTVMPPVVFLTQTELQGKNFAELDVILHTPGGHIESAFNITKLLRKHAKKVNIIVPYMAKSAGTLICLGADKLILNVISELGPLDTQIREMREGDSETFKSALNGFKALEQVRAHALENLDIASKLIVARSGLRMGEAIKLAIEFSGKTSGCLYNQLNPVTIGEYARALEVGERYGITILSRYMGWAPENAINVVRKLVYEYPSHGFSIDIEEIKSLGLNAEEATGEELKLIEEIKLSLYQKDFGKGGTNVKLIETNEKDEQKNEEETKRNKSK
ncbi:MAG: hypothetical protein MCSN_1620 [Candidatus Microsyncoccus archaeolyticus]|nr:MAG: hypothetical protein MCSN_1620 [Candidatus Parcubacteria bacterium]